MVPMVRNHFYQAVLPVYKRHFVSVWASRLFEHSGIKRLFGLHLVALSFVASVISPQIIDTSDKLLVEQQVLSTPILADIRTKTTFEKPLAYFAISQLYSFWHPGIDMTAPESTSIYAIERGVVEVAEVSLFGYGKHVVVAHEHGIKSLYAHMSDIAVMPGQEVERGTQLGKVGSTGWSTGNHLHLEIYTEGKTVNPLEVLPIKSDEIVWDGTLPPMAFRPAIPQPSPTE